MMKSIQITEYCRLKNIEIKFFTVRNTKTNYEFRIYHKGNLIRSLYNMLEVYKAVRNILAHEEMTLNDKEEFDSFVIWLYELNTFFDSKQAQINFKEYLI